MDELFGEIERAAGGSPGSIALASRSGHLHYRDLLGNLYSAERMARRNDIESGQLVFIASPNPDARLIVALALMRIGCRVAYSVSLQAYEEAGVAVDVIVADPKVASGAQQRLVLMGPEWFTGADGMGPTPPSPALDYSIVFSSSGSTGRPKLIEFGAKAVRYRVLGKLTHSYYAEGQRFLSASGDTTSTTFQDMLVTLIKRGMVIRPADRKPSTLLDMIKRYKPDYCALSPGTLVRLLDAMEEAPTTVDKIRMMRVAGAYCPPELQRAALDRIAERLITSYGATEIGRVTWGFSTDVAKVERSVGRIVDGIEVAAFDEAGRMLPPGTEGEIRVKVPEGAAATYPGTDSPERQTFKDGWFVTGDLGLVDEDRNLIVRGRASSVINFGGNKLSPEVFEEAIASLSHVRDVGVAGIDGPDGLQQICAAIVSKSKLGVDDINAHLRRKKSLFPVQVVKVVREIPRTENGKIDRVALGRLCSGSGAS